MVSKIKKCLECGTKNPINADYCAECGIKFPTKTNLLSNNPNDNIISKTASLWDKQSKGFKIFSGVIGCCIGSILILMVLMLVFPTTNLSIDNLNVEIDNQTTEYLLKGKSEANATVKISSQTLNLSNVDVKVDENGNFEYKVLIPIDVTETQVKITAKAPKKSENFESITIKRPLIPLSVNKPAKLKSDEENLNISGKTDPNAEITISSANLNIETVKVNSDASGNFNSAIKVSKDKTKGNITVTAQAVGKRNNSQTVDISRESETSQPTTPTPSTSVATNTPATPSDNVLLAKGNVRMANGVIYVDNKVVGTYTIVSSPPAVSEDVDKRTWRDKRVEIVDFSGTGKYLDYYTQYNGQWIKLSIDTSLSQSALEITDDIYTAME